MGAWGCGHFENDDALDWAWSLDADRIGAPIRASLESVARTPESTEVRAAEASRALAAATVVAAALGRPTSDHLPDEARAWLDARANMIDAAFVDVARRTVERVRRASELRDLWQEADADEWLSAVDELQTCLGRDADRSDVIPQHHSAHASIESEERGTDPMKRADYLSDAFAEVPDVASAAEKLAAEGARPVKVLDGVVTAERVTGSVLYVAVPEAYAFYGEHIGAGPTDIVLALPQWVFDLVDSGWSSGPSPENGFVMLWQDGQPPATDVIVPLLPTQASGPYRVPSGYVGRRP